MNANKEVSKEVKDQLNDWGQLVGGKSGQVVDDLKKAHDNLDDFINKKTISGKIKDEDYQEYLDLEEDFKEKMDAFKKTFGIS